MKIHAVAAFALGIVLTGTALGQSWPQKPVKFIVPFSTGGAADLSARLIGEKLSQMWGQPVIVENRVGAGGALGATEAARAPADGYTLFFPTGSVMTAHQHMYAKLSFNPERDFIPVTNVAAAPQVLVVSSESPYKTVQDLIEAAKADPGKLTFGHAGFGSQTHLAAEKFVYAAKINAVSVPYKGDVPALTDLVGGVITFTVTNISSTIGYIKNGRLRALGVTSTNEIAQLPGVPPVSKTLSGFESIGWFGIVAPTGTPKEIVMKIYEDSRRALQDTQLKARMDTLGLNPVGNSPEEMGRAMKEESAAWERIIRERNLRVN